MNDMRDILSAELRRMGFDGLYNEDGGCGCSLGDLMPCETSIAGLGDCKPALERVCPCCGATIYLRGQVAR